jgi:hypothetical protein
VSRDFRVLIWVPLIMVPKKSLPYFFSFSESNKLNRPKPNDTLGLRFPLAQRHDLTRSQLRVTMGSKSYL